MINVVIQPTSLRVIVSRRHYNQTTAASSVQNNIGSRRLKDLKSQSPSATPRSGLPDKLLAAKTQERSHDLGWMLGVVDG
jgi:hypothetical protein